MTEKTYKGACHCGAVRFEAEMDLARGTMRCNCSICWKARAWFATTPAEKVRVLQGQGALADYRWKPAKQDQPHLHYHFCKTCGVRAFAYGDSPELGKFYAIAISTLENVDADELAGKIRYVDGAHDRYDREPEDTRLM